MASQQDDQDDEPGDAPDDSPLLPKPTSLEVQACQFSSWYSTFRNIDTTTIQNNTTNKKTRKNVTIESIIIRPLPSEFIEYLLSDGVRLPECATKVSSCMNDGTTVDGDDGWDRSSEEEDDDGEDEDDSSSEELKTFSFPTLTDQIQSALTTLGGDRNAGCMPKLNWSSPKDATWINCGSLKCTKVGDVYLLLKSSDFVGFDLEMAWTGLADGNIDTTTTGEYSGVGDEKMSSLSINQPSHAAQGATAEDTTNVATGIDIGGNQASASKSRNIAIPPDFEYELVLRKWCNLHPSMEFRCFVYDHELVAISQRHPSKFYPHLQPPSADGANHPSISMIHAFFQTYIQNRFCQGEIHRYIIDLYLDSQERVWIVDFNVWGDRTDCLLFDWKDLERLGSDIRDMKLADDEPSIPMPEMRVVTKDMKSMTYDPLSSYRGPTDVMDLVGSGNGNAGTDTNMPSFEDFMKQCIRPSEM
mmetsp:Transcript_9147/g.20675  ORF Transcript_9147/g.20675 Transcript_9147/m.20675 type:complete len:472 (+) Transcript_9147:149-1564(+)